MNVSHYIGFDVHKKHINFCIKTGEGAVVEQGRLAAQRSTLRAWAAGQTQAWHGAMEATLFSGWIYDTLEALRHMPGDGTSAHAEGHCRQQEKERRYRCRQDRRPGALPLAACLLRGRAAGPRT